MAVPIILVVAVGLVCAVMLTIASKVFYVPVDETAAALREVLPGAGSCKIGKTGILAMILFIDASVRQDSRTRRLANALLSALGGEVKQVRLENVCRLLVSTTLSISDVTTNSGYEPTSNLSHLFRRTYGMSMRDYRARHAAGEAGVGAVT